MNKEIDNLKYSANDIPKYKKKSQAKGLPRSKHKHQYIPVLLHRKHHFYIGEPKTEIIQSVTKVCQMCGRIDKTLRGAEWYDTEYEYFGKYSISKDTLNKKALSLPKWYADDFFDKFAHQ